MKRVKQTSDTQPTLMKNKIQNTAVAEVKQVPDNPSDDKIVSFEESAIAQRIVNPRLNYTEQDDYRVVNSIAPLVTSGAKPMVIHSAEVKATEFLLNVDDVEDEAPLDYVSFEEERASNNDGLEVDIL